MGINSEICRQLFFVVAFNKQVKFPLSNWKSCYSDPLAESVKHIHILLFDPKTASDLLMEQGELKIIARFKQRDAKAFAYIFKLHRKPLVYFAEKILGIREEAEDIVADSFMKLWDKHADFDHLSQIKSFLYVVTRNSCLNFLKYSKRVSDSQKEFSYWADDKEEEILHLMYRAELLTELNSEIEILPGKMREVFELSFFHELPSGEIADKLGLSVKTVRNQRAKAVHLIKTAFLKRNLAIGLMV